MSYQILNQLWEQQRKGTLILNLCRRDVVFSRWIDQQFNQIYNDTIDSSNFNYHQKSFHILNNLNYYPKCPVCGNLNKWNKGISRYTYTCSSKCNNVSIDNIEKRLTNNNYKNGSFNNIGHNEQSILDCMQLKFNVKIQRNIKIGPYCIDGYISEKNMIIEVNEPYHLYNNKFEKDLRKYQYLLNKDYKILLCWDNLKLTKFQNKKIQILKQSFPSINNTFFNSNQYLKNIKILTENGWSKFNGIKRFDNNKTLIQLQLDNNINITGTEDQKIYIDKTNYKLLKDFKINDIIKQKYKIIDIKYIINQKYVYDPVNVQKGHKFLLYDCISAGNCLIVDEAAWIPEGMAEGFFTSVFPTVSSSKTSKIILVSTPNGMGNMFYQIWNKAILRIDDTTRDGVVRWTPSRIDWWDVPGRDEVWKQIQLESLNNDWTKFQQEYGNCIGADNFIEVLNTETNQTIKLTIQQFYQLIDNNLEE